METSGSNPPGGSAAWATWVAFAGIMMMLVGVFSVIGGLAAAFDDSYFVGTGGDNIYLLNATAVGIIWMIIGVIEAWAGYALIQGRTWARLLTIALCFFHAAVNMVTLTTQPILGLILIAFNIVILYAVTVRWEEAKIGMGD